MFFVWIAATFFFYISSILMFLNERIVFGIILFVLGFFFTISLIGYYRKRRNRKGKSEKKKTDEPEGSTTSPFWDCLAFDCFDCTTFFSRPKGVKAESGASAVTNTSANGGSSAVEVGGGSSSGGDCDLPFDCDCTPDCSL